MKGKELDVGQDLMIKRFLHDIHKGGKYAIAIVADNEVIDPEEDVILHECNVRKIRINDDDWREPTSKCTVGEFMKEWTKLIDHDCFKRIAH